MILGTALIAIVKILHMLINAYMWVIIIGALISFVNPDPYNQIVQLIYRLTEPVYAFIRRYIPTVAFGIDFAPLIVIVALQFIDMTLYPVALMLASKLL